MPAHSSLPGDSHWAAIQMLCGALVQARSGVVVMPPPKIPARAQGVWWTPCAPCPLTWP